MQTPRILELAALPVTPVDRERWTAIIPAAGHGVRLGYHRPKILYPLVGRPIFDWLVDALSPVCSQYVIVVSPEGRAEVELYAASHLNNRFRIIEQKAPTGMGDATLLAADSVNTPNALVIWGDQVTLRSQTVQICAGAHEAMKNVTLTLPTIIKHKPYIHIERDGEDRIIAVHQAREGEIVTDHGENDCGLFLFSSAVLFETLVRARRQGFGVGRSTGEFNLLQVIPLFETGSGQVLTVRIADPMETLGVNTREDARLAEAELRRRIEADTAVP